METLLLEHARYSELTNSTQEEMYTRLYINITHAKRVSRYHLSGISLIYARGKRAKEENSISVSVLAKCLFLIYPAILCRASQSGSSQLQRLRSLITDDLRAIESHFQKAPMQSRTASRDGKCFLSDNFISLSSQLRRSAPSYV